MKTFFLRPTIEDSGDVIFDNIDELVEIINNIKGEEIYVANLKYAGYTLAKKIKLCKTSLDSLKKFRGKNEYIYEAPITLSTCSNIKYGVRIKDLGSTVGEKSLILDEDTYNRCVHMAEYLEKRFKKVPKTPTYILSQDIIEKAPEVSKIGWKMQSGVKVQEFRPFYRSGLNFVNAKYVNVPLNNVFYYDFNSAYIYQMLNRPFPMSKPLEMSSYSFENIYKNSSLMWLAEICISDFEVKHDGIDPFKLTTTGERTQYITNLDFHILEDAYEFEYSFISGYVFTETGELPQSYKDIILGYYKTKEEMKAKKDTEEFDEGLYNIMKIILNALFGKLGAWKINFEYTNIFWAIYITAWQRYDMWGHIRLLGNDFIYTSTDSIFSINKSNSIIVGDELGQCEHKLWEYFIINGCAKYIEYNDWDDYDFRAGGCIRRSFQNLIDDLGIEFVFSLYEDKEKVPLKYMPQVNYYWGEDNICKLQKRGYKL